MRNVVLFDFNNLAIRNYFVRDVEAVTGNPNIQLWKYLVFSDVYNFFPPANDVVLAIDSKTSWRKLYCSRYKERRRTKRDDSKIDWEQFFDAFDRYIYELKQFLPFKVLQISTAEADDIIAVLCMSLGESVTIHSTDEDFLQLCSDNTRVYNPKKGEFVSADGSSETFIIKKCLTGQPKDDIFNILTPLDWPVGKRKPGFGEVSAKKVMAEGYEKWLKLKGLEERFKVNRVLIDFNRIPGVVRKVILKTYKEYTLPDPDKIFTFFKKNKFKGYMENFTTVESKLLELY